MISAKKYRKLFELRATGELEPMECTKNLGRITPEIYKPGMRILDIPCGVGHYFRLLNYLPDLYYVGMDLDHIAIDKARYLWRDYYNADFKVHNIYDRIGNNLFDIVICYNVLLHLENPWRAISNLLAASRKYIIFRSLFDENNSVRYKTAVTEAPNDYIHIYSDGEIPYYVLPLRETKSFITSMALGCKYTCRVIDDDVTIQKEAIDAQAKSINADSKDFDFVKGYKIILVEKLIW